MVATGQVRLEVAGGGEVLRADVTVKGTFLVDEGAVLLSKVGLVAAATVEGRAAVLAQAVQRQQRL